MARCRRRSCPSSPKSLHDEHVLDEAPLLSADLLALCRFAATHYVATLGEVLATAVLSGLRAQSQRLVRRLATASLGEKLTRAESEILRHLPGERPIRLVEAEPIRQLFS